MPLPSAPDQLADQIDALLPQTQCRQCGFTGCRPYAEAIASGEANINRCPPGGEQGIHRLARLTGKTFSIFPVDVPQPKPRALAVVIEENCIGCTLCIQACPVDAIVGAAKRMHTIIADECTGCALCIPPCPVDAIEMIPVQPIQMIFPPAQSAQAKQRYTFRLARQARDKAEKTRRLAERSPTASPNPIVEAPVAALDEQKKAIIAAAMQRAARRQPSEEKP